jgi:hypothetical protein
VHQRCTPAGQTPTTRIGHPLRWKHLGANAGHVREVTAIRLIFSGETSECRRVGAAAASARRPTPLNLHRRSVYPSYRRPLRRTHAATSSSTERNADQVAAQDAEEGGDREAERRVRTTLKAYANARRYSKMTVCRTITLPRLATKVTVPHGGLPGHLSAAGVGHRISVAQKQDLSVPGCGPEVMLHARNSAANGIGAKSAYVRDRRGLRRVGLIQRAVAKGSYSMTAIQARPPLLGDNASMPRFCCAGTAQYAAASRGPSWTWNSPRLE